MAYQHPKLAQAIGWKWNHQPGMTTCDGWLTGWPTEPRPTDLELEQWVNEYLAYLLSPQSKDDEMQVWLETNGGKAVKAIALLGVDKGLWTLAELKQKYRSL